MKTIQSFWSRLVEGRRRRAAEEVARFLITTNADFRYSSEAEMVAKILSDQGVTASELRKEIRDI